MSLVRAAILELSIKKAKRLNFGVTRTASKIWFMSKIFARCSIRRFLQTGQRATIMWVQA